MSKTIRIKKGLNIKLAGSAPNSISTAGYPEIVALQPENFDGVVPGLLVKEGDDILAGTPVFANKHNSIIQFCSPVSGEIVEILRGEKRKILAIKILADKEISYIENQPLDPLSLNGDQVKEVLLKGGAWPFIRQRPYGIIPNPAVAPKAIFISAFDSAPLAPDLDFVMKEKNESFQNGINALSRLTEGMVHININAKTTASPVFTQAKNVQINSFDGPHPAGNVGVQIHHIDAVNKGETVWYVHPQDVAIIGNLFLKGRLEANRLVALTGSQIERPSYYNLPIGSAVKNMIADGGIKTGATRIVSGNILSGRKAGSDGFIDFYDTQVTALPEGEEPEFMGWLSPGLNKFSMSRTFFSWLTPNKVHAFTTNLHGEERPFVVSGEYEKVFPMDIYPVQLLKSILIEDLDMMEKLGIYEVTEEDFALCEVVCTSKIKSQEIIRQGLEMMRKEFS